MNAQPTVRSYLLLSVLFGKFGGYLLKSFLTILAILTTMAIMTILTISPIRFL